MTEYRRRPTMLQGAIQWHGLGPGTAEVMEFCGEHVDPGTGETVLTFVPLAHPSPKLWVTANQAWVPVEPGEWFIRDARGVYPCKPDIFAENYEAVPSE